MQEDISFTDLIASSIHDMKNSLNLQVTALEKVAMECRDRGDTALFDELGGVLFQAKRTNVRLVELLSLYKLGKSTYPIDMQDQALHEVIEELVLQNRFMLEVRGITLSVDCAHDCYWYLDRELVKGALVNALNNAYRYTHDRIHIVARLHNQLLELRVEDNGSGYPPSMLFSEATGTTQGVNFSTGSTGLGFYFSSQVAHLHKNGQRRGTLTLENGGSLGGACFVLQLP